MQKINGAVHFATPLEKDEDDLIFCLDMLYTDRRQSINTIHEPGTLILGDGYSRWISESWWSDEELKQL